MEPKSSGYVLNTLVFPERNYLASPPVEHNTPRRVAIVVKKLQENGLRFVLWREDNLDAATPDDVVEVETQGFTAGFDHLDRGETDRTAVWVMTGYGTHSSSGHIQRLSATVSYLSGPIKVATGRGTTI